MTAYLTAMAISAGIYALLALGVNLTWGMAGMINLGLAGFFAVGGYATALLTKAGIAIPFGIAAGALAAAVTGAGVALITARLRADYLAIVTLGFSEVRAHRGGQRDLADQRVRRHRRHSRSMARHTAARSSSTSCSSPSWSRC